MYRPASADFCQAPVTSFVFFHWLSYKPQRWPKRRHTNPCRSSATRGHHLVLHEYDLPPCCCHRRFRDLHICGVGTNLQPLLSPIGESGEAKWRPNVKWTSERRFHYWTQISRYGHLWLYPATSEFPYPGILRYDPFPQFQAQNDFRWHLPELLVAYPDAALSLDGRAQFALAPADANQLVGRAGWRDGCGPGALFDQNLDGGEASSALRVGTGARAAGGPGRRPLPPRRACAIPFPWMLLVTAAAPRGSSPSLASGHANGKSGEGRSPHPNPAGEGRDCRRYCCAQSARIASIWMAIRMSSPCRGRP